MIDQKGKIKLREYSCVMLGGFICLFGVLVLLFFLSNLINSLLVLFLF